MKLWQTILASIAKKCEGKMITESDIEKLFEKECYIVKDQGNIRG